MIEETKELVSTLLTPARDTYGKRKEAAEKLSSFLLDVDAFNALYSICAYPDFSAIEDGLLTIAGKSIGKILSERDKSEDPLSYRPLEPKLLDGFHQSSLESALSELTEEQREKVYEYAVENSQCSESLSLYFYHVAAKRSLKSLWQDPFGAVQNAAYASGLFERIAEESLQLKEHFENIAINIIACKPNPLILKLGLLINKNFSFFDEPRSDLDCYFFLHIHVLAKLISGDLKSLLPLLESLQSVVKDKYPADIDYISSIELILKRDFHQAYRLVESLRLHLMEEEKKDSVFYQSWYVIVNWLIKERIF